MVGRGRWVCWWSVVVVGCVVRCERHGRARDEKGII